MFPLGFFIKYSVLHYATFKPRSGRTSARSGVTSAWQDCRVLQHVAPDSSSLSRSLWVTAGEGHRTSFSLLPVFTWEGWDQLTVTSHGQHPAAISLLLRFSPLSPSPADHPCLVLPPRSPLSSPYSLISWSARAFLFWLLRQVSVSSLETPRWPGAPPPSPAEHSPLSYQAAPAVLGLAFVPPVSSTEDVSHCYLLQRDVKERKAHLLRAHSLPGHGAW